MTRNLLPLLPFHFLLAVFGTSTAEPVLLDTEVSKILIGKEKLKWADLKIPEKEQVAGLKCIEFEFRAAETGPITTPEMRFKIAGKSFVHPQTDWFVFDEVPNTLSCFVRGRPHPKHPHFHQVLIDLAGGPFPVIPLGQIQLVEVPAGVEANFEGSRSSDGVISLRMNVTNPTGKPVTLTRHNFAAIAFGPNFPSIEIPQTKPVPKP